MPLQTTLTELAHTLHLLILYRIGTTGEAAASVTLNMNDVIDQYNAVAAQLNAEETPGLVLRSLDHVSDFALWSVKAIASTTANAVQSAGSIAAGVTAKALIPLLIALGAVAVAIVYAGGKSGALKVSRI